MKTEEKKRLKKAALILGALLAIALIYAFFISKFIAVPCVFHSLTGLNCPGCGTSRMFLQLFQGDFEGALHSNALFMLASPVMFVLFVRLLVRYVKKDSLKLTKIENIIVWVLIALFVIFGILRNIPMFSFLAP